MTATKRAIRALDEARELVDEGPGRRKPVETSPHQGLAEPMTENRIVVPRHRPGALPGHRPHRLVRRGPAAPTEEQLIGLPEEQRFAADVDGSDPATYPGI